MTFFTAYMMSMSIQMVPPTVNGSSLLYLISAVECSVALNLQFETPCVSHHYYTCSPLFPDSELLADFASHHNYVISNLS